MRTGRPAAPGAAGRAIGDPRALLQAALFSLGLIVLTPFIGQIRNALMRAFPSSFLRVLAVVIGAIVALAFAAALLRIREHRARRYGALALSLALFAAYVTWSTTGNASVDVVERVHFVEYGLIATLFYRAWRPAQDGSVIVLTLLCGILVGTLEEWLQWLVPVRTGEARDVFLNVYALVCGILLGSAVMPLARPLWPVGRRAWATVSGLAAVAVLLFGAFVDLAHLGHTIVDAEAGTFRSYFTKQELLAAQPLRAHAWRADPPRELRTLAVEDYFMTEGGWHVQERNRAYDRGDFAGAWRENLILERYYDPFLDLISFIGGVRHRWPGEQRAFVETRARPQLASPYVSPVGAGRIVTAVPRWLHWSIVIAAAMALATTSCLLPPTS